VAVLIGPALPAAASAAPPEFVSSFAMPGTGAPADFPFGVAVDPQGYVFVVDANARRIDKFDTAGHFISAFGSQGSGPGQFNLPYGLADDGQGHLYVTDRNANIVDEFDTAGHFISAFGGLGSAPGKLFVPMAVAADGQGHVYVADNVNNRIEVYDGSGNYLSTIGSPGSGPGEISGPLGVALDGLGHVYVSDGSNHRVDEFDTAGHFITSFGSQGSGPGQFSLPYGLAADGHGHVFVVDRDNGRVEEFDGSGAFIATFGSPGSGDGQFSLPISPALDNAYAYVTDGNNARVQIWRVGPTPSTLAADPAGLTVNLLSLAVNNVTAHLRDPILNAPIAGKRVTFTLADNTFICSALTDATGTARCSGTVFVGDLAGAFLFGYRASFAGDADTLPSSASGTL
jgi:streptogramin lyase